MAESAAELLEVDAEIFFTDKRKGCSVSGNFPASLKKIREKEAQLGSLSLVRVKPKRSLKRKPEESTTFIKNSFITLVIFVQIDSFRFTYNLYFSQQ